MTYGGKARFAGNMTYNGKARFAGNMTDNGNPCAGQRFR